MRYTLADKLWAPGDAFVIAGHDGAPAFHVDGRAHAWGDKLFFRDLAGAELAYIEQTLSALLPTYEIYRKGLPFAKIVKEFSWWRQEFVLDVPGPNDYSIRGGFWDHEYVFERGGSAVATVSKNISAAPDSYGVDIIDGEDDVAILSTAIVIDLVCQDDE